MNITPFKRLISNFFRSPLCLRIYNCLHKSQHVHSTVPVSLTHTAGDTTALNCCPEKYKFCKTQSLGCSCPVFVNNITYIDKSVHNGHKYIYLRNKQQENNNNNMRWRTIARVGGKESHHISSPQNRLGLSKGSNPDRMHLRTPIATTTTRFAGKSAAFARIREENLWAYRFLQ